VRKAIDNYAQGKQREVEAWTGSSVSASSGRFVCPECLESVALDIRGHFRHRNRTAQSIECDKRVDAPSRSAYERMGLPLYLCQTAENMFSLGIGFSGHDEMSLDDAERERAYIEIGDGFQKPMRYNISYARFIPNTVTIIPVNHLPRGNGSFQIKYSDNAPRRLRSIWTDHTDIWGAGQFFKISENRSRKIRSLGTIVTDEDYYYVGGIWAFSGYKAFVSIERIGELSMTGETLAVYKFHVTRSRASEYQFKAFAELLRARYKVNLLVGESLLLPIWPPCIEDDNRITYQNNTAFAHLYVQTPNDFPSLYRYYGGSYIREDINNELPYTHRIALSADEIPLCVDRAFNGNIQFVCRNNIPICTQTLIADIVDENGVSIQGQQITKLRNKKFVCVTNFPAIVHVSNGNIKDFSREISDEDGLTLCNLNWCDKIAIYTRTGSLIFEYTFLRRSTDSADESRLVELLKENSAAPTEPVTPRILALCKSIKTKPAREYLKRYIKSGYIPKPLVPLLINEIRRKRL